MTHVLNFNVLKRAVQARFAEMLATGKLRRVALPKDENGAKSDLLYTTYLAAFPEGTNPLFRERTEHDCTCCKRFIRDVGDVIALGKNDEVMSIWDISIGDKEPAYQAVADALSVAVKAHALGAPFLHYELQAGTDKSFEQLANKSVQQWDHFYVAIPKQYVVPKADLATKVSEFNGSVAALKRSLADLTLDAVDTVLELIAQKSIYKGDEFKGAVQAFRKAKVEYDALSAERQELFAWSQVEAIGPAISRFRTQAIGTLVEDLTKGVDLTDAVKMYESKVAPTNYKRTTALVTPKMLEAAKAELTKLGLVSALQRRYAVLTDITINNVLFANRGAKAALTGDVFDELAGKAAVNIKSFDKIEEISIEDFLKNVVPTAKSIEALVENRHAANLVSLIAPVDPTSGDLFKWNNRFSWSYNGDVTDSIKERVKAAGGSVTGDLCCRLAWEYKDDLDFHMVEPNGYEISYMNRRRDSPSCGQLDLDANGADGQRDDPAENIVYAHKHRMQEGVYELFVHNYNRRSDGAGFTVELEFDGVTHQIHYPKTLNQGGRVTVAKIKYSRKDGFSIVESLPSTASSKNVWSLTTQTFQDVNVVMLSPNHWDNQEIGNKHYFFMLNGCANEEVARGFYNEFLKDSLSPHRKALELVGSKLKTEKAENQLSGLGFSSTQRNTLVCRVKGSFTRTLKVVF